MDVYKVVLSSQKEVVLREPKIGDLETAAQVAGKGGGDNTALMGMKLQKELVKALLVQVDGRNLTLQEKEQLDKLFSLKEYQQVIKVVQQITSDEGNEPTIEFGTSGDK
jgi:hypothetical protein